MAWRRLHFSLKLPAWCVLIFGLISSFLLFVWICHQEQYEQQVRFERNARFRATMIRERIEDVIEALQAVNQFFVANGSVSREQFHAFTQPLRARYPYIEAFGFQRLVFRNERPAFEARMRARYPDFSIAEIIDGKRMRAGDKPRHDVIDYIEPMAGNERVFGLDTASRVVLHDAVRRTEDTGLPSATGLFATRQHPGKQRSLRILMAVYRGGAVPDNVAARRQAVIGHTGVMLRADDLIEKILASAGFASAPQLHIRVYAAAAADESKLAFGQTKAAAMNWEGWADKLFWHQPASFAENFDVAGTTWHVLVSAPSMPCSGRQTIALLVLLMGCSTTIAATAYLQSIIMRKQHIERLVAESTNELALRTDELRHLNGLLSADVRARKQAEQALRHSQTMLRELAEHQEIVREDERKRIARDIHDDLGQNLLVLKMDATALAARTGATHPRLHRRAAAVLATIDATVTSLKLIMNNLRPASLNQGLFAAAQWQSQQFERISGVRCRLLATEASDFGLNEVRTSAVFRILQESLSNVARHAQASAVEVTLCRDHRGFSMMIKDNGKGFETNNERKANSFGLMGIKERIHALGGDFTITSSRDQGTILSIFIARQESGGAS